MNRLQQFKFLSQTYSKNFNYICPQIPNQLNKNKIAFQFSKKSRQEQLNEKVQQDLEKMDEIKQQLLNQIVVVQQKKKEENKSKKDYRDAILFNEILRKEKDICVYDASGKIFRHTVYVNWGGIILALGLLGIFAYGERYEKRRYWYTIPCVLFALSRLRIYREFQKFFVNKVVYNTENKHFTITKKSFFGRDKTSEVHKNLLIYTQDTYLNNKNINYINMDNLECYQIGYTYAWQNQALFSHLLEQRVLSIKK